MPKFSEHVTAWQQMHEQLPCRIQVLYDQVSRDGFRLIVRALPIQDECSLPFSLLPPAYILEKEMLAELIDSDQHEDLMRVRTSIEDTFNSEFRDNTQFVAFLIMYTAVIWDWKWYKKDVGHHMLISGLHPEEEIAGDLLQVQQGIKLNCAFLELAWPSFSDRFRMEQYLGNPPAKLSECDFTHVPVRITASEFLSKPAAEADESNRMVYMGDTFDIWFEGEKVASIDSNVGGFYLALLLDSINREDHVKHLYLYHKNPKSRAWGDGGAPEDIDPATMGLLFKFSDVELLRDAPSMRKLIDDMKAELEAMAGVGEREKKQDEIERMEKIYDKHGRPRVALKQNSDVGSTVGKRYNEVLEKLDDISKAAAFRQYLKDMIKPGGGGYKLEKDPDRNWSVQMR